MKKSILKSVISIICLGGALVPATIFAQKPAVDVNSEGSVGIGTVADGSGEYKLTVDGYIKLQNWTDILIEWNGSSGQPVIKPSRHWYLQLGTSDKKIGTIHACNIRYDNLYENSDKRLKQNIDTIQSVLKKVNKLNSYTYNFKESRYADIPQEEKEKHLNKKRYGFIAQEIETQFPDLVIKDEEGMMSVNYVGMIPILLQALKEQQTQIALQNEKITSLQVQASTSAILLERIEDLEAQLNQNSVKSEKDKLKSSEISTQQTKEEQLTDEIQPKLFDNAPNPFKESTVIKMNVPESAENAVLAVYDLNGTQKIAITVNGRGQTETIIEANELKPGLYLYALLIDGQLIDTKQMVVTQ